MGCTSSGEAKQTPSTNDAQTTLTLLIRGRFEVNFLSLDRRVLLVEEGDYVIFAPGAKHRWVCLEDNIVITVRWPSARTPATNQ